MLPKWQCKASGHKPRLLRKCNTSVIFLSLLIPAVSGCPGLFSLSALAWENASDTQKTLPISSVVNPPVPEFFEVPDQADPTVINPSASNPNPPRMADVHLDVAGTPHQQASLTIVDNIALTLLDYLGMPPNQGAFTTGSALYNRKEATDTYLTALQNQNSAVNTGLDFLRPKAELADLPQDLVSALAWSLTGVLYDGGLFYRQERADFARQDAVAAAQSIPETSPDYQAAWSVVTKCEVAQYVLSDSDELLASITEHAQISRDPADLFMAAQLNFIAGKDMQAAELLDLHSGVTPKSPQDNGYIEQFNLVERTIGGA